MAISSAPAGKSLSGPAWISVVFFGSSHTPKDFFCRNTNVSFIFLSSRFLEFGRVLPKLFPPPPPTFFSNPNRETVSEKCDQIAQRFDDACRTITNLPHRVLVDHEGRLPGLRSRGETQSLPDLI